MDESSGFQLLLDAASQLEAGTSRVSSFHSAKEDDRLYRSPASSKCQLPIATDRLKKPAQVTAQTKKQLNRMTSSHRYDFENLNIQKLTGFEPVRHRISEHSHARSQNSMNPPKHRASPFSSPDSLTDRSQSRAVLYAQKLSGSHPVGRDTSDRSLGRSQDSVNPPKHRASPFSSSDGLTDRSQSRALLYAQKLSESHPVGRDTSDRSLDRSQDSVNPLKHRASQSSSFNKLSNRSHSRQSRAPLCSPMTFQKQFEKVAIGIGFSANSTVTHNLTNSDDGYHDVSESGNEFSNVAGDLTKHRTTPSSKCQLTVPIDLSKSRSSAYTQSCTKQSHGVAAKSIDICVRSKIVPLLTQKDAVRCDRSMGNFALPEVADDPEIHRESSSAPQMSLVSGRSKARVVPYSIQTTNQFKRLAKNYSYDPQNSNTQKLTGLDSSRPDTSKHSFVHSHNPVNPPKHRVSPSSSFGSLTDRSKSRQLRAPMYSSMTFQKQFEKAAVGIDFSANSSTRHKIAQLDDERYDFSEIGSEFCDISGNTPKHRQSPSLKCLSIPIDLSKSRSSSYFLSCTKQSHGAAVNSSDIFPRSKIVPRMTKSAAEYRSSSSSKHQTTADQSKLQAMQHHRMSNGPHNIENSSILMRSDNFEQSVASLGNTGNLSVSSLMHEESDMFSPSFYKSICRATTSTPINLQPKQSSHTTKSSLPERSLLQACPNISFEKHVPKNPVGFQRQNSISTSHSPMDLRIANITPGDADNNYEDDSQDEEEETEGDPTLLNEYSIYECFEEYKNMHTDDEEFPDSDDDDFESKPHQNRRSAQLKRKFDIEEDNNSGLNEPQEIDENMTINSTHHNLENELHQPKIKKGSIRTQNKQLKLKGMSYTRPDGTVVPARSIKKGCECKMKCSEKYSDAVRRQLLRNLLALKLSGQNQFIANHMIITKTAHPKVVNSRRIYSRSYRLPGVTGLVKICKVMFMATLDITDRKIRNLAAKKIAGLGVAEDDQRCHNSSNKKVSEGHIDFIKKHIDSFPAYTSHYSREGSEKRFLSSDLSVKTMYDLYREKCSRDNLWIPVHYDTYRLLFKEKNLSFRKPKVDVCGECEKYRIALKGEMDSNAKINLISNHEMHQKAAQRVYEEKRKDRKQTKGNAGYRTVSFDLQKQLPTPHLRCGQAFYARQLYTYNLTLFSSHLDTNTATCMMWDETKARRGSQEVASCLLRDLKKMPLTVCHVVYYSDRCVGQNLNKTVVFTFAYFIELCARDGRELMIEHKFMRTGHSHMEVDTVHSAIEKAKKRTTVDIEIPHDWVILISSIRRSIPFEVDEMQQSDFFALKDLSVRYSIPKQNSSGEQVKITEIMVFRYSTEYPGTVVYKHDVGDAECKEMAIVSGIELERIQLNYIENEPIVLSDAKLADLKGLLPFIKNKQYYETFLKSLVPAKRGRKPKSNKVDHFENDMDPEESE